MSPITTIQNDAKTHTLGVFQIPEQDLWSLLAKLPSDLPYRVWRSESGERHLCAGKTFWATATSLSELPLALRVQTGATFQDQAADEGLIAMVASAFDPTTTSSVDFPPLSMWLPTWTFRQFGTSWRLLVLAPNEDYEQTAARALDLVFKSNHEALSALQKASDTHFRPVADTDYQKAVKRALEHHAEVSKIVIARKRTFKSSAPFRIPVILANLDARFANCYVFAEKTRPNGPVFLGASPERLLASFKGVVTTEALAGSAPRGKTDQEDAALGAALMASEKDLREHNHVKTYVQKRLSAVCEDVTFGTLTLKKLANVQHLHTPVTARIVPGRSLLDAAQPLHPTSAVGGEPRETAIQLIREIEGFDRGWYAGLVGWLEPGQTQQGELCVAIRSAVITGDEAVLFAGAGIVEGSDPELEDRETQIKMQAILEALN